MASVQQGICGLSKQINVARQVCFLQLANYYFFSVAEVNVSYYSAMIADAPAMNSKRWCILSGLARWAAILHLRQASES